MDTKRNLIRSYPPPLRGLLFGILTLALLVASDQLSIRFGLRESQRVVDDLIGAAISGFLVFLFSRWHAGYINRRLRMIELMNHHIRNALQVIRYAGYIQPQSEQITAVEEAVNRIDWALREVLPEGNTPGDEQTRGKTTAA